MRAADWMTKSLGVLSWAPVHKLNPKVDWDFPSTLSIPFKRQIAF